MNKKTLVLLVLAAFLGVVCASGLLMAAQEIPDKIKIYNEPTIKKMKKGPVSFSHKKHIDDYKVKCAECHHVYKDGKNTWKEGDQVQKCSECHKAEKEGKADKLQNAFHKDCKDCHKEANKGPFKKCEECHAEKK